MGERAHVQKLGLKHADIDKQILTEMKRSQPDTLRLSRLKKEKLYLKDRMARYTG